MKAFLRTPCKGRRHLVCTRHIGFAVCNKKNTDVDEPKFSLAHSPNVSPKNAPRPTIGVKKQKTNRILRFPSYLNLHVFIFFHRFSRLRILKLCVQNWKIILRKITKLHTCGNLSKIEAD